MKRLFLSIILLVSLSCFGQIDSNFSNEKDNFKNDLETNFELSSDNSLDIYDHNNGVREVTPSKTIEKKDSGTYQIYNVNNGIREVTPEYEIKIENGEIKRYKVNNGIRSITPE